MSAIDDLRRIRGDASSLWRYQRAAAALLLVLGLTACGSSDDSATAAIDCTPNCAADALNAVEVERIVAQTVVAAQARGQLATIAVTDRVGNVLAVYAMTGAAPTFRIDGGRGVSGGLENVNVLPSTLAAISKALTGAYLSSAGNAFSSRTASQIVQEHFNPLEANQISGPLSGVQFSQLPCSDVSRRDSDAALGPKRSPLGLAADPGGLPLYRNGRVVGGLGVIADGVYGLDRNIFDIDADIDEAIALAGSTGFTAPISIRGERITVDGRSLRFVDAPLGAAVANTIAGLPGGLVPVAGYFPGAIRAGTAFGVAASGIRRDGGVFADLGAFILVDAGDANRYPPLAGTDGGLTAPEVQQILRSALAVANRARAQIRRPVGQPAQVTVAVTDSNGVVLGLVRSPDAPVFGTDVAVQKARSAAYFSNPAAAGELLALPDANYPVPPATSSIAAYVGAMRGFLGEANALADGRAYSTRAIGNLARPFFPDGITGTAAGPLAKPFAAWSPFSDGLQLDLSINAIVAAAGGSLAVGCTGTARLANGLQIFGGGVPIYRLVGGVPQLLGGIGVSGDGTDQDDMIGFLGFHDAATLLGNGLAHAPVGLRADALNPAGGRLRYVQCPLAPFDGSTVQNVCDGL